MSLSKQQAEALAYFRAQAAQWQAKASGGDYGIVDLIGQRNDYVLRVADKIAPIQRFLDVGCGSGELVLAMAARGTPSTGIDFAPEMIALARAAAVERGLSAATFDLASFGEFRSADASFDLASALGLIEYLAPDELTSLLDHMRRWVRPGGTVVVGSRNRLFNVFSLNEFTRREAELGNIGALIEEAIILSDSDDPREAIRRLAEHTVALTALDRHPATGIAVETRHQYTPAELTMMLRQFGFAPIAISPAHYHAIPPRLKLLEPQAHKFTSEWLQPQIVDRPVAVPFASTFLIRATREET